MVQLSVIVTNYNYGRYLEACLDSVAAQSLAAAHWELVLVDDGSSDNSLNVAACWLAGHAGLQARLLPSQGHQGHPGLVRNLGIEHALGRRIVCLDADDMLTPCALEYLLQKAQEHPAAIIAGDYVEWGASRKRVPVPPFDPQLVRSQHPCNNAVCYTRTLWQALGGYDGKNLYEDWDFLLRAVRQGVRWERVPEVVHIYRIHGESVTARARLRDAEAKADMVLRSADFFHPAVCWWARQLREGASWVHPFPRGYIPGYAQLQQWRTACVQQMGPSAHAFFPAEVFEQEEVIAFQG